MEKKTLELRLTLEEVNLIFKALGKEPFNDVFELIGKLNEQANAQLQDIENNNGQPPLNSKANHD